MTLDDFIVLQKINLEKFRPHHIQGVKKFNWPTDQSFEDWEKHWEKWGEISREWLRECVSLEIDYLLQDQTCSICNGPFIQPGGDDIVCSGKNPLIFAHVKCWENKNK